MIRRTVLFLALSALLLPVSSPARAQERTPNPGFQPVTVEPPMVKDVTGKYGGTLTWSSVAMSRPMATV